MAKSKNEVIYASDLGKSLSNKSTEIANYNTFAITVSARSVSFTFLYSRGGGSVFSAWGYSGGTTYWFHFVISLSGNEFSCSCQTHHSWGWGGSTSCSISAIRGLL